MNRHTRILTGVHAFCGAVFAATVIMHAGSLTAQTAGLAQSSSSATSVFLGSTGLAAASAASSVSGMDAVLWDRIPSLIPGIGSMDEWVSPMHSAAVPLGCFTETGIWSTERKKCAPDQGPFLLRLTVQTRSDDDVPTDIPVIGGSAPTRERIDELLRQDFLSPEYETQRRKILTETVTSTLGALKTLTGTDVPADLLAAVGEQQSAIRQQMTAIDTASAAQLDRIIADMLTRIRTLQELLSAPADTPETMTGAGGTTAAP